MSPVARRVARNFLHILTSQTINKIISVVFIVFAARLLGAKAYGLFTLVMAIITIASTFTNFGIRAMMVRRISRDRENASALVSNVLALKLAIAVAAYLLLVIFVNLYGYPDDVKTLVYIGGAAIVFNAAAYTFETVFVAFERMKAWGAFTVAGSFAFTALSLGAISAGYGLKSVFFANAAVAAVVALTTSLFVRRRVMAFGLRLDRAVVKDVVVSSLPFLAGLILVVLNSKMDVIMLSMMKGPVDGYMAIGYYAPAANFFAAMMLLPRSLNNAILPMVSRKIYTDEHEVVRAGIEKTTRLMLVAVGFPVALSTTLFSGEIIGALFGEEYLPAASILTLLGWAFVFEALNAPINAVLGSGREIGLMLPVFFMVLLLNVVLNYLLIPHWSYVGAAWATVVSMAMGFVARFFFLRRIFDIRARELKGYAKLFLVLFAAIVPLFYLKGVLSWPLLLVLTAALYPALLYMFKAFSREEVDSVRNILAKRVPRLR